MPATSEFPHIAIVDIPRKGKGVIAKQYIPTGALIISEKPRITLPSSDSGMVDRQGFLRIFEALSHLSRDDAEFLMSFPCPPLDDPILGRLKHFTPCLGDKAFGLCPTICRVNHTCYSPRGGPNASYRWNSRTKQEDLRAISEIHEGQEIEVSYMSDIENYESPPVYLRRKFGFECCCNGCTRPLAERLASDRRILAYNAFVPQLHSRFGRESPLDILGDIEAQILIICKEGYLFEVAGRADDAFELCASYGDATNGRRWEEICRDCYAIELGTDSDQFKTAQRLAARPQDYVGWLRFGRKHLKGPSDRILEYCCRNGQAPRAVPTEPSTSGAVAQSSAAGLESSLDFPSADAPPKLSKSQKKKAKARAKYQAGQKSDNTM